jgi:hypothetical protein
MLARLKRVPGYDYKMEIDLKYPKMPKIVCLCGSVKFEEAFRVANRTETLAGNIVLSIGCNMKTDTYFNNYVEQGKDEIKVKLDELHKHKIDLADEVLVLNVGGYIGESTRSEINYAIDHSKVIRYLEEK